MSIKKVIVLMVLVGSLFSSEELPSSGKQAIMAKFEAKKAVKSLVKNLIPKMKKEMKKSGVPAAISFCSAMAMEITTQTEKNLKDGIRIKRVSQKYRNPLNKPDSIDNKVIEYFKTQKAKKEEYPKDFMIKLRHKTNKKIQIFRYYKPLLIKDMCLNCHGEVKNLSHNTKEALKDIYPNDKAVGYKKGDLRGFIVVEISPKALVKSK